MSAAVPVYTNAQQQFAAQHAAARARMEKAAADFARSKMLHIQEIERKKEADRREAALRSQKAAEEARRERAEAENKQYVALVYEIAELRRRSSAVGKARRIMHLVCKLHRVTLEQMVSHGRSVRYVRARQAAMYLIHKRLYWSTPRIGKAFGDRDHTTVLHAIRRIEELRAERRAERSK